MHKSFVIGVDGGGTKTVVALADTKGRIIRKIRSVSSNPNKVGLDGAISCLGALLGSLVKGISQKKVKCVYLALAGSLERDFKKRQQIKNALLSRFPKLKPLASVLIIDGDQKAAFRSGTDEKDGVVLIAGTGSIAMGWRATREAIAGGWDYVMGDQGSAFWVGSEVLKATCRELDGRGSKTRFLTSMVLSRWKIKKDSDLLRRVYGENLVETVASLAAVADKAAGRGDRVARDILRRAGEELALMVLTVVKKLRFQKQKFPLVLIGGMFNSRIVMSEVQRNVKAFAPRVKYIRPKREPVAGAVELAAENIK